MAASVKRSAAGAFWIGYAPSKAEAETLGVRDHSSRAFCIQEFAI
jgi:hypothetical protein